MLVSAAAMALPRRRVLPTLLPREYLQSPVHTAKVGAKHPAKGSNKASNKASPNFHSAAGTHLSKLNNSEAFGEGSRNSTVTLLHANGGWWDADAAKACPQGPRAWLFLYGHYRSHGEAKGRLRRTMEESTRWGNALGHCYFVVAALPDLPCMPDETEPKMCEGTKYKNDGPTEPQTPPGGRDISTESLIALMGEAQNAFGGRLAYTVMRRSGGYETDHQARFGAYSYAMWAAADAAVQTHGFAPADSSVVIRTRPDVYFSAPFELGALEHYFANGTRGDRLVLTTEHKMTQADMWMATSWGYYRRGIALPVHDKRDTVESNGEFGGIFGLPKQRQHGCVDRAPPDDQSLSGCSVTAVESFQLRKEGGDLLRLGVPTTGKNTVFPAWKSTPRDLAQGAHALCYGDYNKKEAMAAGLELVDDRYWRHFWRSTKPGAINLTDTDAKWPPKC